MSEEDQEMVDVPDEGEEVEFDGNEYNIRVVREIGLSSQSNCVNSKPSSLDLR
jgi:hypothetical protein